MSKEAEMLSNLVESRPLIHLSLFSGIGGLDLAAEWAGFRTAGQCEYADYPAKVLEKHWPDVPLWRDIRTLTKESFYERTGLRTADVISGGFPCQPFSTAGKRRGREDDRYLWPEMVRVIKELRPAWVVGENVAGIISLALDDILSDLEAEGYKTRAFLIPACAVGALHQRYRVAIVAHSDCRGRAGSEAGIPCFNKKWNNTPQEQSRRTELYEIVPGSKTFSNTDCRGRKRKRLSGEKGRPRTAGGGWWKIEPGVGRVADGISCRVDRLKGLGNAVVPQQFYPIFQAIAEIENEMEES